MAEEEKKAEGKKEAARPKKEAKPPAAAAGGEAAPAKPGEAVKRKLPKGRHLSAIKRQRQNLKRRERNERETSLLKTAAKKVREAVAKKDSKLIQANLRAAVSIFHKAAAKGIIHPRNASRHISRLSKSASAVAP